MQLDKRRGFRRFVALLSGLLAKDHADFANWWYLITELVELDAQAFQKLWKVCKSQTLAQNKLTLQSMLGEKGRNFDEYCHLLDISKPQTLLDILEKMAACDEEISKDHGLCRCLCKSLSFFPQFQREPLLVLHEMLQRNFTAVFGHSKKIVVSTIHSYKGLENRAIVFMVDYQLMSSLEKMHLTYVALSRAQQFLLMIDVRQRSRYV